jgi:hypothetical protein
VIPPLSNQRDYYDQQRQDDLLDWQEALTIPLPEEAADFSDTWTTSLSSEKNAASPHEHIMGPLSKAVLLPAPFCAAIIISALFWQIGRATGAVALGALTAVISYPLVLIPLLLRLRRPIHYCPLLSLRQKICCIPVILLTAMLLGWIWIAVVDHYGRTMNHLDLFWWCGLLLSLCISLAYL